VFDDDDVGYWTDDEVFWRSPEGNDDNSVTKDISTPNNYGTLCNTFDRDVHCIHATFFRIFETPILCATNVIMCELP
jgi:hypothetical protein